MSRFLAYKREFEFQYTHRGSKYTIKHSTWEGSVKSFLSLPLLRLRRGLQFPGPQVQHTSVVHCVHVCAFATSLCLGWVIDIGFRLIKWIKGNFRAARHWDSAVLFCPMSCLSLWMLTLFKAYQTNTYTRNLYSANVFVLCLSNTCDICSELP